eukprot:4176073-Pleurochrysis_carterae.AAC.1
MVIGRCRPRSRKRNVRALRSLRLHAIGKHATELTTRDKGSMRVSLGETICSTRSDFRSLDSDSAVPGGEVKISMQIYCWSRNAIQRVEKVGANIV